MKVAKNLTELIGNTPLVDISEFINENDCKIFAKVESFNPLGSIKDRAAMAMIEAGEKEGKIKKDSVIIEPTSGNTGVGLAFICAVKGYRLILTMPESMSNERKTLVKALGAELVLTPASKGMQGSIDKAEELASTIEKSFVPQQFKNMANPAIHKATTAKEIIRDTDGTVDILVGGVGSGGTISGTGEGLKEYNKNIKVYAVEPATSAVMSGECAGTHKIQGIGAGFIPDAMNMDIIDGVIKATDEDSFKFARESAKKMGLLIGISGGAALAATKEVCKRAENKGKTVVVILPDSGERYLSTELFANL